MSCRWLFEAGLPMLFEGGTPMIYDGCVVSETGRTVTVLAEDRTFKVKADTNAFEVERD